MMLLFYGAQRLILPQGQSLHGIKQRSAGTLSGINSITTDTTTQSGEFLRAGIWKPRTRPNDFEGVRAQGKGGVVGSGSLSVGIGSGNGGGYRPPRW